MCFFWLFIVYEELLLHLSLLERINTDIIFVIFFSLPAGAVLGFLCEGGKNIFAKITCAVILIATSVIYGAQFIYFKIFGSFFSVSQISMGGEAITSFWKETVYCIYQNLLWVLLIILPVALFYLLKRFKVVSTDKCAVSSAIIILCIAIISRLLVLSFLQLRGTGYYTPYDYYYSNQTGTDESVEFFGIITTIRLEATHMLFPVEKDEGDRMNIATIEDMTRVFDVSPNRIDAIDFAYLNTKTNSSAVKGLNNYFLKKSASPKNQYTGLFEGQNLIMICAESFSPYVISEQLTPTLYKLYNEGIIFNNFYNSFPNTTTNGEYTMNMGIFPDLSRNKYDASFVYAADNYLPYCMGNMFKSAGAIARGYHNYKGSYYKRYLTHPAMGYTCKFMGSGMKFSTVWPTSDYEMMQQSVDDYISSDRFVAYYMTFSGHYQYNFSTNPMCIRNRSAVSSLNNSTTVKAYIACHLELEKAMAYLMQRLEEAGKAENTVIVLTTDHYPYGLSASSYNELAGQKIDTSFGKYKNAFICWNGGLEENIYCDEYCCTADILPTLLNLFGFEYDSRLLIGTDALSKGEHIAILANQSFITDYVMFDSTSNKATWLTEESEVPSGRERYLNSVISSVKTKLNMCTDIVNTDYYRFVYNNTVFPEKTADEGGQ